MAGVLTRTEHAAAAAIVVVVGSERMPGGRRVDGDFVICGYSNELMQLAAHSVVRRVGGK